MGDVSFSNRIKVHLLPFLILLRKDDWILDHYVIRNVLIRITLSLSETSRNTGLAEAEVCIVLNYKTLLVDPDQD